jgi:hypothetical protein
MRGEYASRIVQSPSFLSILSISINYEDEEEELNKFGYGDLIVFQESLLHQISISSSKMKRYYTIMILTLILLDI